jgi:hypothetical protein
MPAARKPCTRVRRGSYGLHRNRSSGGKEGPCTSDDELGRVRPPPLASGDVLGLNAMEMLACPPTKAAANGSAHWLAWLDRTTDRMMSSAWASHRDSFDRPGARIVHTRVRLDRAGSFALGALVLPSGRYCHVRLTFTRLPATTGANALPALENSLRFSRPGNLPPLAPSYIVGLELPFAKPWQAGHGNAQLTLSLDPSSAAPVLADASLSEGALLRLVVARWVASSQQPAASSQQPVDTAPAGTVRSLGIITCPEPCSHHAAIATPEEVVGFHTQ